MRKVYFVQLVCILLLISVPVTLGTIYAVHNTDSHHWGFILGTALDFQQGRSFFSEIYVQYGLGINYVISLLGRLHPITYTSVGIFMSVVYAGTLVLVYLSLRQVSSTLVSFTVALISLLIHPYSIYPWPDYLAGFSLAGAVYIIVRCKKYNFILHTTVGMLLFAAFIFRSTYLINIIAAGMIFFVWGVFNQRMSNAGINYSYLVFMLCFSVFLSVLYWQGNLELWYSQALGAAGKSYGVGPVNSLTLVRNILIPDAIETYIFLLMFVICLIFLVFYRSIRSAIDSELQPTRQVISVMMFLSILGVTGFVQCTMIYEVFRLQNACLPLFVASAYWINFVILCIDLRKIDFQLRIVMFIFLMTIVLNFPVQISGKWGSTYWPIIEPPYFTNWKGYKLNNSIPILMNHRLLPDVELYYSGLAGVICARNSQVVNLTRDPLIPYLCGDSRSVLFLPMFSKELLHNISPLQLTRIREGRFRKGDLIVYEDASDQDQMLISIISKPHPTVKLYKLGEWIRPKSIRWLPSTRVSIYQVSSGFYESAE